MVGGVDMYEEIKVGEYVRTEKGYIGILIDMATHENGGVSYPEPQEWDIRLGNGKLYVIYEADMQDSIKNHSKNLIDLIEVGDVITINGYKYEIEIRSNSNGDDFGIVGVGDEFICLKDIKNIKTILTHEQYEANCFKVGEVNE